MKKPALFPPHQVTWWRLGCALLCLSLTFGCGSADTDLAASLVDTGSTGTFPDDIAGGGLDASLPDIVDGKMGEDAEEDGDASSAGGGEVSGPVNDASSIADAEPQQDVISSEDIDASAGDPSDTVGEDGNVRFAPSGEMGAREHADGVAGARRGRDEPEPPGQRRCVRAVHVGQRRA